MTGPLGSVFYKFILIREYAESKEILKTKLVYLKEVGNLMG
jgi:hypothetical protein